MLQLKYVIKDAGQVRTVHYWSALWYLERPENGSKANLDPELYFIFKAVS